MKKKQLITRRKALVAGVASLSALLLPGCSRPLPPSYGNILRMGDALTYAAHRALLPGQKLVREFDHRDISSFPATGTTNPALLNDSYGSMRSGEFADFRLSVEGLVSKPLSYSLSDLQNFPARTQITRHMCEEGWTAIAEWTGVPLGQILEDCGISTKARYVNLYCFDGLADSIDLLDAFHPQTILAYGMNGRNLPIPHGAPVRLRVENQMGYKSVKYLERIVVTDEFDDMGKKGLIQSGWAWYAGV